MKWLFLMTFRKYFRANLMKTETLKKIAQELKADGYKLESMRFSNSKGGEVTLWIDGNDEIEDKIQELKNKINVAHQKDDLIAAAKATDELINMLDYENRKNKENDNEKISRN